MRECIHSTCTNTVICHFLNENYYLICPKLTEHPNFVSVLLPPLKRGPLLARILLHFPSQILLPMHQNDSIGRNWNFEKLHWPNSTFWTAKLDWLRSPQTYDKRTFFWMSPTGTFYSVNYVLKSVKVLGFTQKQRTATTPINLTADGCSDQAHAFECTHTVPLVPLAMLCTAEGPLPNWLTKWIYIIVACLGFETQSPVHFRTWNWKTGNTPTYCEHLQDRDFQKLVFYAKS